MKLRRSKNLLGCAALCVGAFAALPTGEALACGGFFCSANQPVNQAAERIVFANNADETVTAIIQIMYEGPSENFSWLLPIATVPNPEEDEIAVSSDLAFQRLQAATNPTYSLTTRVEGTCRTESTFTGGAGGTSSAGTGGSGGFPTVGDGAEDGVTVEASGVVGSFEWTVISFDDSLADPADAAVTWLEANDYDVTPEGAALIGPYLEEGMFLLALKLVKGADTGSIRPIVLTYDAGEPMIPIKLTAVAANDDMGVMAWLLDDERAVPNNYLSLELNEAQINWFNASSNYNDVVIAAAKEAGGQGFVTEFAGSTNILQNTIWTQNDQTTWDYLQSGVFGSFSEIFNTTWFTYGSWDGYWDAVRETVTLPENVLFEDFQLCPDCYSAQVTFSPSAFLASLEENVIEPVRLMQDLFDERAYATRLYTTMSAADMTLDPSFTFNGDLEDVDNNHTAERIIECNPEVFEWEAPWRIEFPQGTVIRGTAADFNSQVWPTAVQDQPANFIIKQLSASGEGQIVTDNSETVQQALEEYNDSLDLPSSAMGGSGGASSAGGSSGNGGSGADGGNGGSGPMGTDDPSEPSSAGGGGGCAVSGSAPQQPWLFALGLAGLALLGGRRQKKGPLA